MTLPLSYEIVDVFTEVAFAGNQLAVVYGADDLDGEQMLALAREFRLSETAFVLSPTQQQATYRVRIFTTEGEVPFAGHPSIGTAVSLQRRGSIPAGLVRQECLEGVLPIEVDINGRATLTGGQPRLGPPLDPVPLLTAAGLEPGDLAEEGQARLASCGMDFVYLPVRADAVDRARPVATSGPDLYLFAWDRPGQHAHARVFVPGALVGEDPATGSGALGLGVWLVGAGLLGPDGTSPYVVHQGAQVHRPSILECSVTARSGLAVEATVRGSVVAIGAGEIMIPPRKGGL
jgi:trans-2,3-dihydro-3-hydroxyanthranilate isomerase